MDNKLYGAVRIELSKMQIGTLDPPEAPRKIFRRMGPNDIASRFFTSWYTIYEGVSSCQATAVDATTDLKLRCAWAARLVESCAWRGSRRVTLRFNSPDADCLHIIYLWRVMGSRNSDYGFSELRIEPYNVFGSLAQPDKRIGGLMSTIAKLVQRSAPAAPLILGPLNATSLRDQAYALLKNAIADTDIYDPKQELRLDERQLTAALGVSRTPIREALSLLEQEGFIRTIPRRGIYIIRKSKREMIEMIQMWAALESMAARLATLYATDAEIARLRHLFDEFQNSPPSEHLDEYSDANIAFHTAVIALGGSQTIVDATRNLLIHVRAIRRATIVQSDRAARSIVDHLKIIEALEQRDTELAERLTRQHTLDLAAHVDRNCDFLD